MCRCQASEGLEHKNAKLKRRLDNIVLKDLLGTMVTPAGY